MTVQWVRTCWAGSGPRTPHRRPPLAVSTPRTGRTKMVGLGANKPSSSVLTRQNLMAVGRGLGIYLGVCPPPPPPPFRRMGSRSSSPRLGKNHNAAHEPLDRSRGAFRDGPRDRPGDTAGGVFPHLVRDRARDGTRAGVRLQECTVGATTTLSSPLRYLSLDALSTQPLDPPSHPTHLRVPAPTGHSTPPWVTPSPAVVRRWRPAPPPVGTALG